VTYFINTLETTFFSRYATMAKAMGAVQRSVTHSQPNLYNSVVYIV